MREIEKKKLFLKADGIYSYYLFYGSSNPNVELYSSTVWDRHSIRDSLLCSAHGQNFPPNNYKGIYNTLENPYLFLLLTVHSRRWSIMYCVPRLLVVSQGHFDSLITSHWNIRNLDICNGSVWILNISKYYVDLYFLDYYHKTCFRWGKR